MTGNDEKELLEEAIEDLKNRLYDHDRAVIDRVGLTGKPSPEEKKARSAILRDLNKSRRILYKLTHGQGKPVKIGLTFSADEYQLLAEQAEVEGMDVKRWLKLKVLS